MLYVAIFLAFDFAYARWVLGDPSQGGGRAHAVAHPVHHHDLAPLVVASPDRWGPLEFSVTTNSLGFRDTVAREIPMRGDRPRVLLMGDSFTFGVGYDYARTFAHVFTRALAARGTEVLNAAVVSYSPVIHARKLRHLLVDLGLEVDEVLVLLDISDTKNDALDYDVDDEGRVVFAADRRLLRRLATSFPLATGLVATVARSLGSSATDAEGWSTRGSEAGRWTLDDALYDGWGRRGQRIMADHMDEIVSLTEARGIGLVVAVYPWTDQILAGDLDSVHVRFWRGWCRSRGVRFLDFFPDFVSQDPAADRATVDRYFIPDDIHFNEAGNRYFARRLIARYTQADGAL